jgi:hypothetical protein
MCKRLETILAEHNYATLVACDGKEIVGFIGTRVGPGGCTRFPREEWLRLHWSAI